MTPFEHLAVLISIVLGLGLTHLLTTVHHLIAARGRVRMYWLPLVWTGLLLVTQVEWWWAIFGLRHRTEWNFFYFLFVLLSPGALYLAAAFVLPRIEGEHRIDLRAYYYESHRWLFPLVAVSPALDAVRHGVEDQRWMSFAVLSNATAAVLVGSLAFSKRAPYHGVITLLTSVIFAYVIVSSALELR
ncbi:hypothetical protein tb265_49620 [Gemmatimonadetes bacterium T265]|nr:hypothetical protein tb265_49620 [Gemmatimonadetes bacterium T265]